MKKLLGGLLVTPLALTACFGGTPARDSKLVAIEAIEEFDAKYQFDDTSSDDIVNYTKRFTDVYLEKETARGTLPVAKNLISEVNKFSRTYEGLSNNKVMSHKMDWNHADKAVCFGNDVTNGEEMFYVGGNLKLRTELESKTNVVNVEGIEVFAIMSQLTKDQNNAFYSGTKTTFKENEPNYFVIDTTYKVDASVAGFAKQRKFYKFKDGKVDAICWGK